jgi:hypothetical protein
MRLFLTLVILTIMISSCNDNSGPGFTGSRSENKLKKQAFAIAEDYVSKQLTNPKKNISKEGIVVLRDSLKAFVISPAKIFVGLIDDDSKKDAIVSLDCYVNQYQVTSEHLILLNSNGKITFNRGIESDMTVLGIKDRLITAEIHTHTRNSPLFNCKACLEVVKYKFSNGDLVETK